MQDDLLSEASGLLEPLGSRRAGERIAERLATAIALGQYWPGQRLPSERRLAELLGVSRSTVRDALHLLTEQGLLVIHRGATGGAFVAPASRPVEGAVIRRTLLPGWSRLSQLLDFRCAVESQIARLAAERRTGEEAERILRLASEYLTSGPTREQSSAVDRALHDAIAQAVHNPFWVELSAQLRYEVNQGLGVEPFSADLRRLGEEHHPQLANAVAAGDAEAAAALAAKHFALNTDVITNLLASVGRPDEPAAAGPPADGVPADGVVAKGVVAERATARTRGEAPGGTPATDEPANYEPANYEKEA